VAPAGDGHVLSSWTRVSWSSRIGRKTANPKPECVPRVDAVSWNGTAAAEMEENPRGVAQVVIGTRVGRGGPPCELKAKFHWMRSMDKKPTPDSVHRVRVALLQAIGAGAPRIHVETCPFSLGPRVVVLERRLCHPERRKSIWRAPPRVVGA